MGQQLQEAKAGEKEAVAKAQKEQLAEQKVNSPMLLPRPLRTSLTDQNNDKTSQAQEIENLSRENALMATAWYELSSRLQQNNVDLQRRAEPRSWLNKQRKGLMGVGATAR